MKKNLLLKLFISFLLYLPFLFLSINNGYSQGAGYALEFDGTDDYVAVPSSSGDELNPLDYITFESWLYLKEPASATHRPHFVAKNGVYALVIETNGLPRLYVHDGSSWHMVQGITTLQVNKWYHIAGTYDGNNATIYVNGIAEGTPSAFTSTIQQNSSNVTIGNRSGGIEVLNGLMDEVRIWEIARTEAEIQNSMNQKLAGNETGLVGYWRLDDGTGTTAADLTSYGNDGTLTNMTPVSDWVTSIAPIGDASIFAESADISEVTECAVDVTFGTALDAPGAGFSLAAIQVDETPNDNTGIMSNMANVYWELWSEDTDFDGDFTATVNLHYDNISGISGESFLKLYRRDSASAASWNLLTGYTIVSDDGGSSTETDGIGYIQIPISETTPGSFSGQYIIVWNIPPGAADDVANTPEDTPVIIDVLANDSDADGTLDPSTVAIAGAPSNGTITKIDPATGEITYAPTLNFDGIETFTYTVRDNNGAISNAATVTVTVDPVNDPPVISIIPDQSILEGESFTQINLDDYVSDPDHSDDQITWTVIREDYVIVNINNRIATITVIDDEWNGSDGIIFTAIDPLGVSDSDTVVFTIIGVNDPPFVANEIPDTSTREGESFTFTFEENTFGDVDPVDALVYEAALADGSDLPGWLAFDSLTRTFSGTPASQDRGTLFIVVTAIDDSLASVTDTFKVDVMGPVGIIDVTRNLDLKIYPNPNQGVFRVEMYLPERQNIEMKILSLNGQLIWNELYTGQMGSVYIPINIETHVKGMYILKIITESGIANKRIIIQ